MVTSKLARAALWYGRNGWHVFPLRPCTKEPFAGIGAYEATDDERTIFNWWRRWPDANIAVHCGASGIIALDADSYKDTYGGAGLLSSDDEDTVTALTGGGGTHLLYAMPDDREYGNARGALPEGIDVRGMGGYLVVAPSIHPNGHPYQWESGYGPHEMPLHPLPAWLRDILDAASDTQAANVEFGTVSDTAPDLRQWRISRAIKQLINEPPAKGGRSEADYRVVVSLVLAGASNDDILSVFEHYPIGQRGKYADKGRNALRYLQHTVGNARGWAAPIIEERRQQAAAQFMQLATR